MTCGLSLDSEAELAALAFLSVLCRFDFFSFLCFLSEPAAAQ